MKSPLLKDSSGVFGKYLEKSGLKRTKVREILFHGILTVKDHFTIEDLLVHLQKEGVRITIDTLYRNIVLLEKAGIVAEIFHQGRKTFYEVIHKKEHHDHMTCVSCGRIFEFHSSLIEKEQLKIARKAGFRLTSHTHKLVGYCAACQQ